MSESTNVFATPGEIQEVKVIANSAWQDEMLEAKKRISTRSGLTATRSGPSRFADQWIKASCRVHELALLHGLPEIEGFYGMDKKGQFIAQEKTDV